MLLSSRHRGRRIPGLREDRGSPLRGNCRDCLTKTNSQESRHPRPLIWGSVSKDKALDADKLWSSHYEKVREGDFFVSFWAGSHRTRLRSALSGEPDRTGCGGGSRTVPEFASAKAATTFRRAAPALPSHRVAALSEPLPQNAGFESAN